MQKLKKAAAVALMVGGLGLAGGSVASAQGGHGGHDYDEQFPAVVDNLQVVDCDQSFDGGLAFANLPVATGDSNSNIGNFCTVIGSIDD